MRVEFHPSIPKQATAILLHCKCLRTIHCQWRAPDPGVPGEVGSGVSAAMDDVPFPYLTGVGISFTTSSVAIQSSL